MADDFDNFLSGGSNSDSETLDPDVAASKPGGTSDFEAINLDEIDENAADFPVMAPGWYPAIVINTEAKHSSNGNPMIVWNYELRGEHNGRQMFYNNVLNKESGLKRLKKAILAILPEFDFRSFHPKKFVDSGEALGKPVLIRLKVGSYQGKPQNNVSDVKPYTEDEEL